MNSRWQANKTGLINFWYYDEQEFPFVNGRMLLRGSNGSGKSVTMQSVVPLLLDGNMSPERLDPFGSRDRKMSSYLLEEDDEREERTGYLYLEFKRRDSDTYFTIGMGIKAKKRKQLDKWYFGLSDGRRIGKDFYLYKDIGEKVPLSKKELENRIGDGGRVFSKQSEYMEYVNRNIFGFGIVEEYKEMIDLLIQLRTPKLSKDFKPSVINDILSDSLQPLSDDDLRPMSEAIESMDQLSMNLKSTEKAYRAAFNIDKVFSKYNKLVLYEKADDYEREKKNLKEAVKSKSDHETELIKCREEISELEREQIKIEAKNDAMQNEMASLRKSDAVELKNKEMKLKADIDSLTEKEKKKEADLAFKQNRLLEEKENLKAEEDKQYEKKNEITKIIDNMNLDADIMSFVEHEFFCKELMAELEKTYKYDKHEELLNKLKGEIEKGKKILDELKSLEGLKDKQIQKRDECIRELNARQKKLNDIELMMTASENEWKEALIKWNSANKELVMEEPDTREMLSFADNYSLSSDFNTVRDRAADVRRVRESALHNNIGKNRSEMEKLTEEKLSVEKELSEWQNMKDPEPPRSEAVLNNRKRLTELGIPYQEFYKVIEFGKTLDESECGKIEETLMRMGILDAVVIEEQYREKALAAAPGCEDNYLFAGEPCEGKSLLDVLELNDEVNDLFSNQRLTGILRSISYNADGGGDAGSGVMSVSADGSFGMGVITGTVTGEHEAGFLGTKAREKKRQAMIEECRKRLEELSAEIAELEKKNAELEKRKEILLSEYESLPNDADMKASAVMLRDAKNECAAQEALRQSLEDELSKMTTQLKAVKKNAVEASEKLGIQCSLDAFTEASEAATDYTHDLSQLKAKHEVYISSVSNIRVSKSRLNDIQNDIDTIRDEYSSAQRDLQRNKAEYESVLKQLEMTDYKEIKDRLDECSAWLKGYNELHGKCVGQLTEEEGKAERLKESIKEYSDKVDSCKANSEKLEKFYVKELELGYCEVPEELNGEASKVRNYLANDVKSLKKNDVLQELNNVYFGNKADMSEYSLTQGELFSDLDDENDDLMHSPKRFDLSGRYDGVKISFKSLMTHLEEEIENIKSLIKENDRNLFEEILANNVSRKIRGKINSSTAWVKKMNDLMGAMNTSSGLRLSLRWRSRAAEHEDQLDTRELVELLKKDYNIMSETESERLSLHFRSKIEEARRRASDDSGIVSFYQIMKETLDYRKWFEFQLLSQKNGEKQKELTNSVFGTFSGGEKAMAMYVPLFSAVVAKYQGGRGDAPRLISLDEAFAGVDNRNIRDMFRLMSEFEFDFIINSQVLWGDCDTLDALAIYQLVRPENAKFVTVMPYVWNGHSRELMDNETDVEMRGAELG